MRIKVVVRSHTFNIQVGPGTQYISWLAFVAAERYCIAQSINKQELPPKYAIVSPTDDEIQTIYDIEIVKQPQFLAPHAVINTVLKEEQCVTVLLQGEDEARIQHLDSARIEKHSILRVNDLGEPNEFKDRLFSMFQDPKLGQYVDWKPGGNSLVIKDKNTFVYGLLHKYFTFHNIVIFQNNLKRIGFLPAGSEKAERLEYIHPFGKDLKKSKFQERVTDFVVHAARVWKTSVDVKKLQSTANEPDSVETGQIADAPLQYLKRKLKNLPLYKDFLREADIDVNKLALMAEEQKQELNDLHKIVMDHLPHLRAYFRYTCLSNGEIHGMGLQSFRKMCQLCNISDQMLSPKEMDAIFNQSAQVVGENKPNQQTASGLSSKKKESARQLTFNSFLAAVLKLGMKKYFTKDSLPSQRLAQLFKLNILPQATPVFIEEYSTLGELHQDCTNPKVLEVLEKHQRDLAAIYAKAGGKMNFDSFKLFLMQARVVGDEYQFALVKQAFVASSILINVKDGEIEVCRKGKSAATYGR